MTLSILDGVQGGKQYFYHLVTDASAAVPAVLEKGVFAPRLAKIPQFGKSLPEEKSALLGFSPVLNGRTDKGSGEDQGFSTALANGIDPINVFPIGPDNDNRSRENNYSPLWDAHVQHVDASRHRRRQGPSHPLDGRAEILDPRRAAHQRLDQSAGAWESLCRRSAADPGDHQLSGDRAAGSPAAVAIFVLVLPVLFSGGANTGRCCHVGTAGIECEPQRVCDKPEPKKVSALPLIVFDVNETLLNLQAMEPIFERIFGERNAMRLWFANFIMYSAALTVAGCYVPFTDIGSAVMKMLADTRGIKIGDAEKKDLTGKFSTMPPHPEVPAALRKLRDAGFRLFTLTDNLLEVQTRQLTHGGIVDLFERRFSADGVKHHKPSPQAYAYVERELGAGPSQFCLIACHTWDTLGAVAAGWEAALIKRVGNDVLGVGPQPQIVGNDLNDVADQLIARHKAGANQTATKARA